MLPNRTKNQNKKIKFKIRAHDIIVDSDTVSTYQVFKVQLVTDKKLETFNKCDSLGQGFLTWGT